LLAARNIAVFPIECRVYKKLLTNSATSLLLHISGIVIAFVVSPIFVRTLGNRDYGAWEVVSSIAGYLGVLDLGISPAIVCLVARASAQNDQNRMKKVLSSAIGALTFVGLVSMTIMLVLTNYSYQILNARQGEIPYLKVLFVLMAANLLVQFPGTAFVAYLMGLIQYNFINVLRLITGIIQAMASCYLLLTYPHKGLFYLICSLTVFNYFQYIIIGLKVIASSSRGNIHYRHIDGRILKELTRFGLSSMILMAADRLQRACIPLVLAHTTGLSQIVFFVIPKGLIEYARGLALALSQPLMPYYGYLDGKGDLDQTREKWCDLSKWMQYISLGIAVSVITLGENLLRIWMGAMYAEKGKWILYFLGASMLLECIAPNAPRYLIGSGKHGKPARIQLAISIVMLGPIYFCAKYLGINGVAAVLFVGTSATTFIFLLMVCKNLQLSFGQHFTKTVVPLIVPGLAVSAVLLLARIYFPLNSYLSMALAGLVAGAVYLVGGWYYLPTSDEKNAIRRELVALLSKLVPERQKP